VRCSFVRKLSHWCRSGFGNQPHVFQCVVAKAAFTRYKFARASQVPGMRAQTFLESRIMENTTSFKLRRVKVFITCTKHLRAHPRHLTCESQLAWCKHGWRNVHVWLRFQHTANVTELPDCAINCSFVWKLFFGTLFAQYKLFVRQSKLYNGNSSLKMKTYLA
jgi:hypothetical protein